MTETERIVNIYKDFGVTEDYLQKSIESLSKTEESPDIVLAAVRVCLALSIPTPSEFYIEDWAAMLKSSPNDPVIVKQYEDLREEMIIAARYKEYGVSTFLVDRLVRSGLEKGFSRQTVISGVLMGLAMEYGKHEYFTSEDVAGMLGTTAEEANDILNEQSRAGLIETKQVFYSPILQ